MQWRSPMGSDCYPITTCWRPSESAMPVRLVVAHRSGLVRDVLRILGAGCEVHVVGETAMAGTLVQLCGDERPSIAVSEADLACGTPIEDVILHVQALGTRVIVICDDPSPERLTRILGLGVAGFLRSDCAPSGVLDAVKAVARGAAVLDPSAAWTILEQWRRLRGGSTAPTAVAQLTNRETQVLAAMADGLGTKAIACRLDMAVKTVENHKTRIFDKLGVRSQAAAVSYAIGHGLLTSTAAPSATVG
jgi:DNA-binding NarL/FixJ family response regulator